MKILALPRDANPYQELLYKPMRNHGAVVEYLGNVTGSHTVNLLLLPLLLIIKRLQGFTILHVHWTYVFTLPFGGALGRACMELWAAGIWILARIIGMRIIWTAHNALPHEPLFWDDVRAHRFLGRMASAVIAHTPAAKEQLRAMGIPRAVVIPHGNYIGTYPNTITAKEARTVLNVPQKDVVFLFFGLIRPYKGVEQLVEAFSKITTQDCTLLIAGSVQDPSLKKMLKQAAQADSRICLVLEYVSDDKLQLLFNAANFTVLPYERSTTSGVSLLACSFRCPVIVPKQAAFADVPPPAKIVFDAGALLESLKQAAALPQDTHAVMQQAAYLYAETLSWDTIADQTLALTEQES